MSQPKALKYNPGCKSALIAAGVGNGKVRLWTETTGKWNGGAAENLYQGDLLKSLKRAYPRKVQFTILEDNDPTGLAPPHHRPCNSSCRPHAATLLLLFRFSGLNVAVIVSSSSMRCYRLSRFSMATQFQSSLQVYRPSSWSLALLFLVSLM